MKHYTQPQIKVKELDLENLLQDVSQGGKSITTPTDPDSKDIPQEGPGAGGFAKPINSWSDE